MHSLLDPIKALAREPGGVLAVLTGSEGPAYRATGATMALMADGRRIGALSSGCIEADIAIHAARARDSGRVVRLRYGAGSSFADLRLPCGGALELMLLPEPCRETLTEAVTRLDARQPVTLLIDENSGGMRIDSAPSGADFALRLLPEIMFYVAGSGAEALAFAAMVDAAGYPHLLLTPDAAAGDAHRGPVRRLTGADWPADLRPDPFSAVVLFFHDHDREPPLIAGALRSRAFYIGAQGSRTARTARDAALRKMGCSEADLARIHGPIGLVPRAREPRLLAVSVLAEILAQTQNM